MYSGYGIALDSAGSQSFDDGTARNAIIFGVDNSSSSHADNRENRFSVLAEGPTFGIDGVLSSPEKNFSVNFSKASTNVCLSLYFNADNSYLFVNGKEILKFKADNENVKFSIQCCLGSTSNGFSATESREVKASKFPKG